MKHHHQKANTQSILRHRRLSAALLFVLGPAAVVWLMVRSLPRPSRLTYPCQQAAAATAMAWLTWILGISVSVHTVKHAVEGKLPGRYRNAFVAVVLLIGGTWVFAGMPVAVSRAFEAPEGANAPMGTAKGIAPGRVVWVYDPDAANFDGPEGDTNASPCWWTAENTDQAEVDRMLSAAVRRIADQPSDEEAWDAIFHYFNRGYGNGDVGYSDGEDIAVKINQNNARDSKDANNALNGSPQMCLALARQLIHNAGVPENNIIFYDHTRNITSNIMDPVHAEFPGVRFIDNAGGGGAEKKPDGPWPNVLKWSGDEHCGDDLPPFIVDASYIINMALLKKHPIAGVTLAAKNHYGTVSGLNHTLQRPLGSYHHFVDMMGSKALGGKTLLYMIDGLYGTDHSDAAPRRWQMAPFNGDWTASLFVSLDPVAIDSVGLDFLRTEYDVPEPSETYLHEAAEADHPESGTAYAPNGEPLGSLGVHEHWNNADDKQYSRNLGIGNGIELMEVTSSELDDVDWPHGDTDTDNNTGTDTDTESDADTDTDTDADTDSDSDTDTDSDSDTDTDSDSDTDTDSDSDADTDTDSDSDTDSAGDIDSDSESATNGHDDSEIDTEKVSDAGVSDNTEGEGCGCSTVGVRTTRSLWLDLLRGK